LGVICLVYLSGLDRVGILSTDEPRYAAIGRHMAESGDWVMPVLWGRPWFEKPPLLYWMTAAGFACGLGPELAPRLPVALLSIGFLVFSFVRLRRMFGERAAMMSTVMLGASAGWLAYSRVAVTDLPLAATFGAAMLLLMTAASWPVFVAAGALFGLAVLAKSLVPLVLVMPALWLRRRRWRMLLLTLAVAFAVATPWHIAMYFRAGGSFVEDLFLRQQFGRFFTAERQHVQPFWFYLPVLIAGLLPWTPALAALRPRHDRHLRFLLAWAIWGLIFFSASTNKLPGYVLPLVPPLCALGGVALDRARRAGRILAMCGLLVIAFPIAESMLPAGIAHGLRGAGLRMKPVDVLIALAAAAAAVLAERAGRRAIAVASVSLIVAGVVLWGVVWTLPEIDKSASARTAWRSGLRCIPPAAPRDLEYGLNYYEGKQLSSCRNPVLNPTR
jgi:4-amino-4-deoxy-L-arabinose transferase-like glycosyltransferase